MRVDRVINALQCNFSIKDIFINTLLVLNIQTHSILSVLRKREQSILISFRRKKAKTETLSKSKTLNIYKFLQIEITCSKRHIIRLGRPIESKPFNHFSRINRIVFFKKNMLNIAIFMGWRNLGKKYLITSRNEIPMGLIKQWQ